MKVDVRRAGAWGLGAALALAGAYRLGRAHADGVPAANPLYYGGFLDDHGTPVEGTRSVTVRLWDMAAGGTATCTTTAPGTAFTAGRFRIALDASCVSAVRANADLWAEVQVDATTFPRSKLGAVPYALESARASAAAGALEARLAALEARASTGRQVIIGPWRPTSTAVDQISIPCPASLSTPAITLTGPAFSYSFTASASAFYKIYPIASLASINGGSGGNYRVRMIVSPPPDEQLQIGDFSLFHLTYGTMYSISFQILPSGEWCTGMISVLPSYPMIIEQFN